MILTCLASLARPLSPLVQAVTCVQDALLDEEGATPADGFSGDANAVSLRLPQAKAETQQRMMTAEEAHEVSKCLPSDSISLG